MELRLCGCCAGSGLCDGLINRSVSPRVRVSVGDLETSTTRQPRPDLGYYARGGGGGGGGERKGGGGAPVKR